MKIGKSYANYFTVRKVLKIVLKLDKPSVRFRRAAVTMAITCTYRSVAGQSAQSRSTVAQGGWGAAAALPPLLEHCPLPRGLGGSGRQDRERRNLREQFGKES